MADSNSACDCCNQPPCPTPTLEFISVSANCETTCATGEIEWNLQGKIQTTTITLVDGECKIEESCSGSRSITYDSSGSTGGSTAGEGTCSGSDTFTETTSFDDDCEGTIICSGSGNYTTTTYSGSGVSNTQVVAWTINADCSTTYSDGEGYAICPTSTVVTQSPPAGTASTVTSSLVKLECTLPPYPAYPAFFNSWESPPALLLGQGRFPTAKRDWNAFVARVPIDPTLNGGDSIDGVQVDAGSTKMERKIKYRICHWPSGTCYLKVWISTIFTPLDGTPEAPVITSYTWTGTGNPCLTVPNDPVNADSQKINSSTTEVLPPATNGTKEVTILKWSCVNGYEPDVSDPDNKQNNGFPDPIWEASPP